MSYFNRHTTCLQCLEEAWSAWETDLGLTQSLQGSSLATQSRISEVYTPGRRNQINSELGTSGTTENRGWGPLADQENQVKRHTIGRTLAHCWLLLPQSLSSKADILQAEREGMSLVLFPIMSPIPRTAPGLLQTLKIFVEQIPVVKLASPGLKYGNSQIKQHPTAKAMLRKNKLHQILRYTTQL